MDCVERGAGVEADALANVVALLPEDLKAVLPEELRAAVGRSGAPAASAPTAAAAPMVEYAAMPAATLETNQIGLCRFLYLARILPCRLRSSAPPTAPTSA